MSTVTLRPMTDAEFAGFRSATARAFADELVAAGGWSPEETAGEDVVRSHGVAAVELNVFGDNARAIGLYTSAGYRVVTQQLRKDLGA